MLVWNQINNKAVFFERENSSCQHLLIRLDPGRKTHQEKTTGEQLYHPIAVKYTYSTEPQANSTSKHEKSSTSASFLDVNRSSDHSGYSLGPSFIRLARHQEIAPWSLRERGEGRFPVEDLSREEVFHRTKGQESSWEQLCWGEFSTHIEWYPSDIYIYIYIYIHIDLHSKKRQ